MVKELESIGASDTWSFLDKFRSKEGKKEVMERELTVRARILTHNPNIDVQIREGLENWSHVSYPAFPEVRKILVKAEDLRDKSKVFCRGLFAHEIGHEINSDSGCWAPEHQKSREYQVLANHVEDPRNNALQIERFPGYRKDIKAVYEDPDYTYNEGVEKAISTYPAHIEFSKRINLQWVVNEFQNGEDIFSKSPNEYVRQALNDTREVIAEATRTDDAVRHYQLVSDQIWPKYLELRGQAIDKEIEKLRQERAGTGAELSEDSLRREAEEKIKEIEEEELKRSKSKFEKSPDDKNDKEIERDKTSEGKKGTDEESGGEFQGGDAPLGTKGRDPAEILAAYRHEKEKITGEEAAKYDKYYEKIKPFVRTLVSHLRKIKQQSGGEPEIIENLTEGDLNPADYWKLAVHGEVAKESNGKTREAAIDAYTREEEPQIKDFNVVIVTDNSASMFKTNKKIECAKELNVFLDECFEQANYNYGSIVFGDEQQVLKKLSEPSTKRKKVDILLGQKDRTGNSDDQALDLAIKMLKGVKGRKGIIMICDGEVDKTYMRSKVEEAAKEISVIGIGFGPETVGIEEIFPQSIHNEAANFITLIGQLVPKINKMFINL